MALLTGYEDKIRQPGSILQPKPGLMDATGNQTPAVLNQQDQNYGITPAGGTPQTESQAGTPQTQDPLAYQTGGFLPQTAEPQQPSITPAPGYTPMADPVNPTNSPLSYQEAFTQGKLNPAGVNDPSGFGISTMAPGTYGSTTITPSDNAGGFGGYDPKHPVAGYDPRAWAMTEFGGSQGLSYLDPATGQMKYAQDETDPAYQQAVNANRAQNGLAPMTFSTYGANQLADANYQTFKAQFERGGVPSDAETNPYYQRFLQEQQGTYQAPKSPEQNLIDSLGFNPMTDSTLDTRQRNSPQNNYGITPQAGASPGAFDPGTTVPIENPYTPQSTAATFNNTPLTKNDKQGNPHTVYTPPSAPGASTNTGVVNTQGNPTPTPQSSGGDDSLSKIYKFFRGELERERDVGVDRARTNAASRGVFYGTPGTRAEEDVQRDFGLGLSSLEANMLQNESQNELTRLGLANNLFGILSNNDIQRLGLMSGLIPQDQQSGGGLSPDVLKVLGELFGSRDSAGGSGGITAAMSKMPTVKPLGVQPISGVNATPKPQTTLPNKKF